MIQNCDIMSHLNMKYKVLSIRKVSCGLNALTDTMLKMPIHQKIKSLFIVSKHQNNHSHFFIILMITPGEPFIRLNINKERYLVKGIPCGNKA